MRYSGLLAVVFFAIMLTGCGRPDTLADQPSPVLVGPADTTPSPLAHPTLFGLDATKAAIDQEIEQGRATALAAPRTPGIPPTITAVPTMVDSVRMGISMDCAPPRTLITTATNCWVDRINGEYVGAVAASDPNDPTQGVLVIITDTAKLYRTPQLHGAVTIVRATTPHLTMQATDGTLFGFDVVNRVWEAPLPTPTPSNSALRTLTFEPGMLVDPAFGADDAAPGIALDWLTPLDGQYAVRIKRPTAESYLRTAFASTAEVYVALALHLSALPSTLTRVLVLNTSTNTSVDSGNLVLTPDGTLQLYVGTTLISGASSALVPGNTYRIGLHQQSNGMDVTIDAYLADNHMPFTEAFTSGTLPGRNVTVDTLKVGAGQAGPINIVIDDVQIDRAVLPGP